MKIALGKGTEVDGQELITGRTLICSMSRYGKSFCARRICEQLFGHAGIAIIDIEGEYSTLLEAYPFFIIGRDVPIVPEAAAFLADEMLKNKLSFIIDGSNPDLDIAVFQEFVAIFVNRFIAMETQAKTPYLFVLEECTELIPEKGVGTSLCSEELTRLVAKGGKRGLGCLIITQRPAFVSKRVISQAPNKLVGRTEWPDDIAVLRKFAQIPESADIPNLKKGDFYTAGPFISKPHVMHVGPVKTTHLGATPPVIPPTPSELKDVVAQLAARVPKVIEEMKPILPKVAEIEARLKEKVESQWQVRLARKDKELASIKNRTEAKYEVQIADLTRKLEDAVRHATLKGGVSDLFSHPLVQKNLEKLNPKQRLFVELLEKGPQDPEHCSLFLETKPKNVPTFVYDINRKIPRLIENQGGRYVSRLAKLFPVTEEAQAEAKESEKLGAMLLERDREFGIVTENNKARVQQILELGRTVEEKEKQIVELRQLCAKVAREHDELKIARPVGAMTIPDTSRKVEGEREGVAPSFPSQEVQVEATLHRTLTSFNVVTSREVLDVDEQMWEGKLLALGLRGFFKDPQGIGKIMAELIRKYGASDNGGNRTTVNDRLTMLVSKDILDRKQDAKQWTYFATEHFAERVRPLQEAAQ